jgi:hypothetical protein
MGSGNFDVASYKIQAEEAKVKKNSGFTAESMCDAFNPSPVNMRFSKRGPFNEFKDVITVLIGLDVTGSMDIIPKSLLEGKLGSLMVDLKKTFNKPNENLQISFAGIGDAKSDEAPLQVTHFESDNRFAQQLQKIWLEGHGGANGAESYNLLWWYAANKTHLNYVKQDGRKGILITIGDDNVHPGLTAGEIQMWLDPKYEGGDISNQVLLSAAKEQYDVYHIVITDGNAYGYDYLTKADKTKEQKTRETQQWKDLLGVNNVIHTKSTGVADAIAQVIKRHRPLGSVNTTNLTEKEWEKQNKENLTDKQWEEVLSYTVCPLTRTFMNHPVDWNGGKRAYEKQAVESYVHEHQRDPITHKKLTTSELVLKPNLNIAQLCSNYQPFFDVLPESRKARLLQLTLGPVQVDPEKTENAGESFRPLFPKHESGQAVKALEKMQLGLECPITHEIMRDPVILVATGQTYERKAIEAWLEKSDTDPLTREKLTDKILVANYAVKGLCDEARANASLKVY